MFSPLVFADVPMLRDMFANWHIPKREVRLSRPQLQGIMDGYCAVIFTGQEILFIAEGRKDELHDG